MPYQFKNIFDYQSAIEKALIDPEAFWGEIAENFTGLVHGKR